MKHAKSTIYIIYSIPLFVWDMLFSLKLKLNTKIISNFPTTTHPPTHHKILICMLFWGYGIDLLPPTPFSIPTTTINEAKQGQTRPNGAKRGKSWPIVAIRGQMQSNWAKRGQTGPNGAKWGQTGPKGIQSHIYIFIHSCNIVMHIVMHNHEIHTGPYKTKLKSKCHWVPESLNFPILAAYAAKKNWGAKIGKIGEQNRVHSMLFHKRGPILNQYTLFFSMYQVFYLKRLLFDLNLDL